MRVDFRSLDKELGDVALRLCWRVREAGGTAYMVGGSVRDALLGRSVVEVDLEVFGLEAGPLRRLLSSEHRLDEVGVSFGVLKLRDFPIDVSLPRRESKTGRGHRGFEVAADPFMTLEEAARRRDFRINAILYDPLLEELFDPLGGVGDLEARILRHSSDRFVEDPLRVLRGMQFVARYELTAAPETLELCASLDPDDLARERIFEEWKKLLLLGERISLGLAFLRDADWLQHFPELEALVDCPQDPEWHPEGDVWVHTLLVMDAFAAHRLGDDREDLVVGLACLCHDLGKPATTVESDGRIRSRGHEAAGESPTRSLLGGFTSQESLIEEVVRLVQHHLKPRQLFEAKSGDGAVRRLARRVGRIDRLARVARADSRGRSRPQERREDDPSADWLEARAAALDLVARTPKPLILGRHLVERGLSPGPDFGPLLERCFEAQLDGAFGILDEGLLFLDKILRPTGEPPEKN